MLVVDVEATGTNPSKHSLLSIGAIDFNDPSRQFHEECRIFPGAHVDPEGLAINGFTPEQITDMNKKTDIEIVREFYAWALQSKDHTVAGLNPQFDVSFILQTAERNHFNMSLAHRVVDLHSICYFHMLRAGVVPPIKNERTDLNSDKIMEYVGIPAEPKPHIALNGAKYEAEAFHRLFYNNNLFSEFQNYKIPWLKKVTRN